MKNLILFGLIGILLLPIEIFGQDNKSKRSANSTTVELSTGVITSEGITTPFFQFDIVPEFCLLPNAPRICWLFDAGLGFILGRRDPWRNVPPIRIVPPGLTPDPMPFDWAKFNINELEIGHSWVLAPSTGLNFGLSDGIKLGVFAGGGVQLNAGRTSHIEQVGSFETSKNSFPVAIYGLTGRINLSKNIIAKLEFRGMTQFHKDLEVVGPNGSTATFKGERMFSPNFNIGVGYRFGDPTPHPSIF